MKTITAKLIKSPVKGKRFRMEWYENGEKIRHTDFGSNLSNFTLHKDEERKDRFKNRFQKLIQKNKNNPYNAMTLSNMILWNKPTLDASFKDYKKLFNFK